MNMSYRIVSSLTACKTVNHCSEAASLGRTHSPTQTSVSSFCLFLLQPHPAWLPWHCATQKAPFPSPGPSVPQAQTPRLSAPGPHLALLVILAWWPHPSPGLGQPAWPLQVSLNPLCSSRLWSAWWSHIQLLLDTFHGMSVHVHLSSPCATSDHFIWQLPPQLPSQLRATLHWPPRPNTPISFFLLSFCSPSHQMGASVQSHRKSIILGPKVLNSSSLLTGKVPAPEPRLSGSPVGILFHMSMLVKSEMNFHLLIKCYFCIFPHLMYLPFCFYF